MEILKCIGYSGVSDGKLDTFEKLFFAHRSIDYFLGMKYAGIGILDKMSPSFSGSAFAVFTSVAQNIGTALILLGSIVYIITICSNRKFYTNLNAVTVNVSIASIIYGVYWTSYFILTFVWSDYSQICVLTNYFEVVVHTQVLYAYVMVSFNRVFFIVYYRQQFFKSLRWILLCIGLQWIGGFLIPLPNIFISWMECLGIVDNGFIRLYTLVTILIIPMIILCFANGVIFWFAKHSHQRVLPSKATQIQTTNTASTVVENENVGSTNGAISRRDIRLLKNILLMLIVFIVGWAPVYFTLTFGNVQQLGSEVVPILALLPTFSLACNTFLLFRCNNPLKIHLRQIIKKTFTRVRPN
ncbi:unnamed protein product [Didymodactylos carnosus]|uniref:G-protein coupled receptors family 1 profile domain-containing protein n=1 Tax=Didymodactylos carnosus TaxID=1234261 RepID=A0A815E7X5_9BILA|nr:unnamed protein product [Didymodactylos carnosus]CAF1311332.1 unnamed protein product [Didymodactylos carnosus]CAF4016047.1 unnamed protein product [Didymodactylos carnosus]CAF4149146.1 unnamed protein product [Didymodactylos carnosus]